MKILYTSLILLALSYLALSGSYAPVNLTVEHMDYVFGIENPNPIFSFKVQADRGFQFSSFYMYVFNWVGEKIWVYNSTNNQTMNIQYQGPKLQTDSTYMWQVCLDSLHCSPNSIFMTGIIDTPLLVGKWLVEPNDKAQGYNNLLRTEVDLTNLTNLYRAACHISGVGYNELYINGQKLGNNKLDGGWTTWEKRVLYSTYEVYEYLKIGQKNAIGIMMGRGWWGQQNPQLNSKTHWAVNLECTFQDKNGQLIQKVVTNNQWKMTNGPIMYDDVYNGETYNASMEIDGWNTPGFDDSQWQNAVEGTQPSVEYPAGELSGQAMPVVEKIMDIPALKFWSPSEGVWVFDLGQHISGWCRLSVKGPAGTNITLKHAEILAHGTNYIYTDELRGAKATDTFILKGTGDYEVYQPRFTYHGFRYVQVYGLPYEPRNDTITGIHVRSNVRTTGQINFSSEVLNKIQSLIFWSQSNNLMSVPTDCDQRDERKGWMGDAALSADEAFHNFDMAAFYKNFLRSIRDAQASSGAVPDTVPLTFGSQNGDPSWGTAYPTILHGMMYYYNDPFVVKDHLPNVKTYLQWLDSLAAPDITKMYYEYADWVPPPEAQRENGNYCSMFSFLHDLKYYAEMADYIGESAESEWATNLYNSYVDKFNKQWYINGVYAEGLQTGQALPLWLGIVPNATATSNYLVNDIVNNNNMHLTTGIIGTKFLLPALSMNGFINVAMGLAEQTSYPSWGYMIYNDIEPATTLWELWNTPTGNPGMDSRDHIMFGSLGSWFYTDLVGIQQQQGSYGYSKPQFLPPQQIINCQSAQINGTLQYASASLNTVSGYTNFDWKCNGNTFSALVTVPIVSQGRVFLPLDIISSHQDQITVSESGNVIFTKGQVQSLPLGISSAQIVSLQQGKYLQVDVTGGDFSFEVTVSASNKFLDK